MCALDEAGPRVAGRADTQVRPYAGFRPGAAVRRKVIIDTDPGTDDALAIMMALNSPELDVRGITTVGGNARLATAGGLG
mgnify:CR=1 FL=1